jgi:hypothetical protein
MKTVSEKEAMKKKIGTFYHPTKETFRTGSCPVGQIDRKGYKTKSGKKVKKTCIKNTGMPGKVAKGYKPIVIGEKGLLEKYGYSTKKLAAERHSALKKAVKVEGYSKIVHRLSALRTLTKSNPKLTKKYDRDMKKIQADRKAKKVKKNKKTKK